MNKSPIPSFRGCGHMIVSTKPNRFVSRLRILLFLFQLATIISLIAAVRVDAQTGNKLPPDVTISVKPWDYARIYPLLDGLFQDVAATQVKTLQLDPNAANATNLDALLQAFQVQGQFTATAGIQNALAAQQANVNSASILEQTQLIGRQSQLIQSQLIAQNQVGVAQRTLDSLTANGASQSEINSAKRQLQLANDSLASITAQLSDIKTQLSSLPTPSFATPPAAAFPTTSPTLPTLTGPANVPSGFSPNFPATKQMDNQVNLLWERVSRLVYTMNQTASDGPYYLLQVNTGIVPINRKHQMLLTRFHLSCGRVVDIYPRTAAINIINEKYRDTRFGLGFLVQLFSFGLNASYNRDHLRITQMLGQSSYITGYGVGMQDFGWLYGISLGEDSISPGTRDTFVLVQTDCQNPQLNLINAEWGKKVPVTNFEGNVNTGGTPSSALPGSGNAGSSADPPNDSKNSKKDQNNQLASLRTWPIEDKIDTGKLNDRQSKSVEKIDYTPLEDNLTNPTPAAVMVAITLVNNVNIDPEATITADGILVNRIRDTFGRAVSSGGSGGVLEASQLQLNTWIPVTSHELLLSLNPRAFRGHFPTLLLQSPRGTIELTNGAKVQIQGREQRKCTVCAKALPPLSYPKAPISILSIGRWMFWKLDPREGDPAPKPGHTGKVHYGQKGVSIVINALSSKNLSAAVQAPTGPAPLQIIDDAASNPWGSKPQVQAISQSDGSILQFNCYAAGPQLVCPSPPMKRSNDQDPSLERCSTESECMYLDVAYLIDVVDADHSGGPFHGQGVLSPCGKDLGPICSQPLMWRMEPPVWTVASQSTEAAARLKGNNGWLFNVWLINVSPEERVQLNYQRDCDKTDNQACADLNPRLTCPGEGKICQVTFVLRKESLPSYRDLMDLLVFAETPAPNAPIKPTTIGGLRSQVSPILTSISSDSTVLSGNNLVFDQLTVGIDGKPIKMTCSPPTDCTVTDPLGTKKGYLYFIAQSKLGEAGLIPVVLQGAQGVTKVLYTPPTQPRVSTPQVEQPKVPLSSRTEQQTVIEPTGPAPPR